MIGRKGRRCFPIPLRLVELSGIQMDEAGRPGRRRIVRVEADRRADMCNARSPVVLRFITEVDRIAEAGDAEAGMCSSE
jgi:hypothetical protein